MLTLQEESSSLIESYKYIRRLDIDSALRLKLGLLVSYFNYRGQVTELSKKYGVCRGFIYELKKRVKTRLDGVFDTPLCGGLSVLDKRILSIKKILELRLIGKCPLEAIRELIVLQQVGLPHSTCFISQTLKTVGSKLGLMVKWKGLVNYASDEVYMIGHQPILVTVDPLSSAILRMELLDCLTKEAWASHWSALRNAGIESLSLVKDEGVVMKAAHQEFHADIEVQTDSFHAISHRLGVFVSRLEKAVYKAIGYEYKRQEVAHKAVSKEVKARKEQEYQEACKATLEAIEKYENFQFLYTCLYQELNCFDYQYNARNRTAALEEMKCALAYMKQLNVAKLDKEIETIEKLLPQLLNFLPKAQLVQYELERDLGNVPAYFWIYAWQNDKKSRKTKNTRKAKVFKNKTNTALELIREHYADKSPEELDIFKRLIFRKLDAIIQSSALVENINSLLRPYMNSARNQLSQEQLNLIRFYLNHRVFNRGKRKGASPFELLAGKKEDKTWMQQLLELAI